MKRKIPKDSQYAYECKLLAERLQAQANNEVIPYDELDAVAGFDVRDNRHVLASARRRVFLEFGMHFRTLRNVGLKLATDEERVKTAEEARMKLQRAARRSAEVLSSVGNVQALDPEALTTLNAGLMQSALVSKITSASGAKKLRAAVESHQHRLPTSKALDVFK